MRTGTAPLLAATLVAALFGLSACKPAASVELSSTDPADPASPPVAQEPIEPAGEAAQDSEMRVPPPTASAKAAEVTVVMSSATLGDDCGEGLAPAPAPPKQKASVRDAEAAPEKAASMTQDGARAGVAARRACQQTSMQLSIAAGPEAKATEVRVKKVQLLDKTGKVVAELTARSPNVWATDGAYSPWDQKITAGKTLSVRYPLSAPGPDAKERNEVYTLKAIVTVGGKDQTVQREVEVFTYTSLPPGAVT